MKELLIEEKAKRYDEAIERAKNTIEVNQTIPDIVECVESLFPELKKESEDERIINNIKKVIGWYRGMFTEKSLMPEQYQEIDAWLEKQGEYHLSHDDEVILNQLIGFFTTGKGLQNTYDTIVEWLNDVRKRLSKQGEQKPADKVEPKFHKGEWLCENKPNNYARFIQILEIVNVQGKDRYRISRDIHKDEDIVEFGFVENYYHKFDIQDAKDGDVLYCESSGIEYIVMSKGINENGNIDSYFRYNSLNGFGVDIPSVFSARKDDITPANKEQCDLLFTKMTKAGYEWDAEKKELKKIEQKPAENKGMNLVEEEMTPFQKKVFCIIDTTIEEEQGLKQVCDELLRLAHDEIMQKPAWSEDDEVKINRIVTWLENLNVADNDILLKDVEWLKSLKERVQPQNIWKPNNEQMKILLSEVEAWTKGCPKQKVLESLYNDLKKLK